MQSWLKAHPDVALEELYPRHMLKAYQLAAKHNRTGQAWGAPAAPSLAIVASPAADCEPLLRRTIVQRRSELLRQRDGARARWDAAQCG